MTESIEQALREGKGEIIIEDADGKGAPLTFSEARACCGQTFPALSPQSFSFNSPLACASRATASARASRSIPIS
ncbi:MAG: hypothetical protein QM784_36705 [Polyangiaceae bacterium]